MKLRVELHPSPHLQRGPAAAIISGGDPAIWLQELAVFPRPLLELELYVLPADTASEGAGQPLGLLVIHPEGKVPLETHRIRHYGLIGDRLLVPVQSTISPVLLDEELDDLTRWEVPLLHPSCGFVGYDKEDRKRVADLLALPTGARPVAVLCLGPVDAFYSRPMLEQEHWTEARPLADMLFTDQWEER